MRHLLYCFFCLPVMLQAQTDTWVSSEEVDQILRGDYDAVTYQASTVIQDHQQIICELNERISADTLQHYLEVLASFGNRNTYSDTVSSTYGVGAARRWVYSKFQEISAANEERLRPAYLSWYQPGGLCDTTWIGDGPFSNILAVLPGTDPDGLVIIEGHMDSRCANVCDIDCLAEGMEDNGSGTALVIELARVMSRYTFDQTIVFLVTTGEEQGLYGANAFSDYSLAEGIAIRQVQNNDIVGGIICGETSSPPSCTEPGSIDSLTLRVFANTSPLQEHRSFARWTEYMYHEKLENLMAVPMTIAVQNQEDRTGRGGDHIPFRENGFTALRFTSANEHGDGAPDADYHDRQHTSDDILGVDTDSDGIIDSFFVSFTYLQRNAIINATMATLGALAPPVPEWELLDDPAGLIVHITEPIPGMDYRVGVRTAGSDLWEWMYRTDTTWYIVPGQEAGELLFVSIAAVNEEGITGLFSREYYKTSDVTTPAAATDDLAFTFACKTNAVSGTNAPENLQLQILPNPASQTWTLTFDWTEALPAHTVCWISDMRGNMVDHEVLSLQSGTNRFTYQGKLPAGVYNCSLVADGRIYATKRLVIQ